MNKRGQFYLVAALIIITIMASIVTYKSYIKTTPISYKIYDLGEELNLETAEVLDYGIYTGAQQQSIMESWASNFSAYVESGEQDFVFLYIDENDNLRGIKFTFEETGEVSINIGESLTGLVQTDSFSRPIGGAKEITITIDDFTTTVNVSELREGSGYYFVVRGRGGEVAQQR